VLSSLWNNLYTRIQAKLGRILNYRYNYPNPLVQTSVTEPEQKLAVFAQQIQVSSHLLDYDEAKHYARAGCGHQANPRLTEPSHLDLNIVQLNNFHKIFISQSGIGTLR
jgi:hypothetical protein